jgi:hypothetical protein
MKLNLNPPGSELLKLNCDDPISNFAFNLNLRRYKTVKQAGVPVQVLAVTAESLAGGGVDNTHSTDFEIRNPKT